MGLAGDSTGDLLVSWAWESLVEAPAEATVPSTLAGRVLERSASSALSDGAGRAFSSVVSAMGASEAWSLSVSVDESQLSCVWWLPTEGGGGKDGRKHGKG